jgi:nucleotide-binding universal stress UspA family protein
VYRKIVVGYDESERAKDALSLAALLRAEDGVVIAGCVLSGHGTRQGQAA